MFVPPLYHQLVGQHLSFGEKPHQYHDGNPLAMMVAMTLMHSYHVGCYSGGQYPLKPLLASTKSMPMAHRNSPVRP
jgi:hypothetical protein